MAVSRSEMDRAPEVSGDQIHVALGGNEAIIRTNAEAMAVAEHVKAQVFRVGSTIYVPFDTKIH